MNALQHKKVLVLGLGSSGLAMAKWCLRFGADVTVADTRPSPPKLQALESEAERARFIQSDMTEQLFNLSEFDLVLKSPGLSPAEVSGVVKAALAKGIPCGNELSLFADALLELKTACDYNPEVIAITGTNGKTTVTALTSLLVARAGKSVEIAGNIGPSLLDTLARKIGVSALISYGPHAEEPPGEAAQKALPEVWVLELSSFQLEGVTNFKPSVATILNITQDHLDWHQTFHAYKAAKANLFRNAALLLLNRDDAGVMALLPPHEKGKPQTKYVTFGGQEPQREGDYGVTSAGGMAWLVRAAVSDEKVRRRKGEPVELYVQRLMPSEALRIKGSHNVSNALAAIALAVAAECSLAPMLHGLREYRGEPHRVESIAVVEGVEYFDDSKGTNVGATAAALAGLGADRKLVAIMGGEGKDQDFSPLAIPVSRVARAVVLIGKDAQRIELALAGTSVEIQRAESMQDAVKLAAGFAKWGDAVLMSPACASFDMFKDYEHRAEVFRQAVADLADRVISPEQTL